MSPLASYSNILTLTGLQITYGSLNAADVGLYDLEMKLSLVRYPDVSLVQPWTVEVLPCQITDLVFEQTEDIGYSLYNSPFTFSIAPFAQVPSCGYTLSYTVQRKDPTTGELSVLPAWLTETQLLQFTIFSDS